MWKFAFGALVLLASGVAFLMRTDAPPKAAGPVGPPIELAPAPTVQEPAPADAPEVQEAPVRVGISLHGPHEEFRKSVRPARRMPAAKLHHVRTTHEQARRPHRASPYVAGRAHYPFEPRERWRPREG